MTWSVCDKLTFVYGKIFAPINTKNSIQVYKQYLIDIVRHGEQPFFFSSQFVLSPLPFIYNMKFEFDLIQLLVRINVFELIGNEASKL